MVIMGLRPIPQYWERDNLTASAENNFDGRAWNDRADAHKLIVFRYPLSQVSEYGVKPHVKKKPLTLAAQHGRAFAPWQTDFQLRMRAQPVRACVP